LAGIVQGALFETDKSKLLQQIIEAEMALVLRARELFHAEGDHIEEEEALHDAMYALRALRNIAGARCENGRLSIRDDASQVA
jgi:hypothetical protein